MSAHTPGPWHAVGQVVKSGASNIAHVTQMNGDPPGLTAANARLIAAAPNLLETLRVSRARIQEDRDIFFETSEVDGSIPDLDDSAVVEQYDALLRVIDADIAKATEAP